MLVGWAGLLKQKRGTPAGKYYTTFDYGDKSDEHVEEIWIREADPDCNPAEGNASQFSNSTASCLNLLPAGQ